MKLFFTIFGTIIGLLVIAILPMFVVGKLFVILFGPSAEGIGAIVGCIALISLAITLALKGKT